MLTLKEIEKQAIIDALNNSKDIAQAARFLKISRATIYRKMKKYEIYKLK